MVHEWLMGGSWMAGWQRKICKSRRSKSWPRGAAEAGARGRPRGRGGREDRKDQREEEKIQQPHAWVITNYLIAKLSNRSMNLLLKWCSPAPQNHEFSDKVYDREYWLKQNHLLHQHMDLNKIAHLISNHMCILKEIPLASWNIFAKNKNVSKSSCDTTGRRLDNVAHDSPASSEEIGFLPKLLENIECC